MPVSRQAFTSGSKAFSVRGGDLGDMYTQIGGGAHIWLNQERTATLFTSGDWNFNGGYNRLGLDIGFQVGF
jgi:hypothetical protein